MTYSVNANFNLKIYNITNLANDLIQNKFKLEECIGPRKLNFDKSKYNADQNEYNKKIENVCIELIENLISISCNSNFQDILSFLGKKRNEIAIHFKSKDYDKFGVLRENKIQHKISTDLMDDYAPLHEDLCRISQDDPSMTWDLFSEEDEMQIRMGVRIGISYKKQEIPLSKYIFSPKNTKVKSTIAHTYPESLSSAKEQCHYLFNEIMRLNANDYAQYLKNMIGELHWWFAQTTPYLRGSASCAEILIAALEFTKFGTLTPYKEGIFPDQIALVSSCEDFVKLYPSLRENPSF